MKLFIFIVLLFTVQNSQAGTEDDIEKFIRFLKEFLDGVTKLLPLPENAGKNITELAELYNYELKPHSVATEDGYQLTIFQLLSSKHDKKNCSDVEKPVVLLMHGLLSSAVDWMNMGPNQSLAYILVDAGYDVWLGNARGNKFSRAHASLDPDKNASFWEFSWHEQGAYDLPATIDYILDETKSEKLSYIGHSEGTTDFFVMGAEKPNYNDKISLMIALAPVAYISNSSSPITAIAAKYLNILTAIADLLGIHEIRSTDWIRIIGDIICSDSSGLQFVCVNLAELIVGFDYANMNATLLPVILTNFPAGAGLRQFIHYGQEINSGYFRQYDFGIGNLAKYQSLSPPSYNTSSITAPVALFYAENDLLSAVANVEQLARELPNVVKKTLIGYQLFTHYDYLWATNVKGLLYDDVLHLLGHYSRE